jgi:predicted acetyltransferase
MRLEEIQPEHAAAFMTMMEDFRAQDAKTFEHAFQRKNGWNELEFKKYIKECEADRMDWRPKAKKTSRSHYVLRESPDAIIAYGVMQFPLDEETEIDGGNLWVAVPPKFRGQGNGSFCLSLLLFEAVRAGLRRVLTTCASNDAVARRVIEKNRGQLLDEVNSPRKNAQNQLIARYWIHFS